MSNTISIITVVYKDLNGLKKTIRNILQLKSTVFEHIVIDGGSGAEVERFLEKCDKLYNEKKITFKWVSESDHGIYDAMNKGIDFASGEWLNFMNAGDVFVNKTVLNELAPHLKNKKALVYGNKKQNHKIINSLPLRYLKFGIIMACHQSMFFNKKILDKELYYDTQFKVYADYELVNRVYKKHPSLVEHLNIIVSVFQGGGISESISYQKRKDKLKIVFKSYGVVGVFRTYMFKYFPNLFNI